MEHAARIWEMRNALKLLSENNEGELREEKNMLQDRQCTYNVTLRHFRATSLAGESNKCYII